MGFFIDELNWDAARIVSSEAWRLATPGASP